MYDRGEGWILFSWIVLVVAGGLAILEGIVALSRASFFASVSSHYVASSLRTWGWVELIMGIVAVAAGIGVYRGGAFGRWAGIIVAAASMFAQMFWVPIVPIWALSVILVDVAVIYGLTVYGGSRATAAGSVTESERDRGIRAA